MIFGRKGSDGEIEKLRSAIEAELAQQIQASQLPAHLSVSVGMGEGKCAAEGELRELLAKADDAMYAEKEKKHENLHKEKKHENLQVDKN